MDAIPHELAQLGKSKLHRHARTVKPNIGRRPLQQDTELLVLFKIVTRCALFFYQGNNLDLAKFLL